MTHAVESPAAALESGLRNLGFRNASALTERLLEFAALLLEANKSTNLVGARSLDALVATHFLDSLAPLSGARPSGPIVDLGSGAGLPGIPAAIAFGDRSVVLLEPRRKRAAFMREAITRLQLENACVSEMTAQVAAIGPLGGRAGTVLVRAVGRPELALALGLPLLRDGGRLLLYLGREAVPGLSTLRTARKLGGELLDARAVDVPGLSVNRHAWWFERVSGSSLQTTSRATTGPRSKARSKARRAGSDVVRRVGPR